MTITEITNYHHVILRALQRKMLNGAIDKSMTFSELWRCVENASSILGLGGINNKTDLAREILWQTELLEEALIVTRQMRARKLLSITLTEFGEQRLRSTVFSHQERAPEGV